MKEETVRALTLAACALQAYALAKSFKREVIDPYREPHREDDALYAVVAAHDFRRKPGFL